MKFNETMRELFEKVLVTANAEFLRQHQGYTFEPRSFEGEQVTDVPQNS